MIKLKYSSIDNQRGNKWHSFKTLKGARAFAQKWVGKYPEIGSTYAVSGDGVGKIVAVGVELAKLFGDGGPTDEEIEAAQDAAFVAAMREEEEYERAWAVEQDQKIGKLSRPARSTGCTCSDAQLIHVGCDCRAEREGDEAPGFDEPKPAEWSGFDSPEMDDEIPF